MKTLRLLCLATVLCAAGVTAASGAEGLVLKSYVKGVVTSEWQGQDYPFEYSNEVTLTAEEVAAVCKNGKVEQKLAEKIVAIFAPPSKPADEGGQGNNQWQQGGQWQQGSGQGQWGQQQGQQWQLGRQGQWGQQGGQWGGRPQGWQQQQQPQPEADKPANRLSDVALTNDNGKLTGTATIVYAQGPEGRTMVIEFIGSAKDGEIKLKGDKVACKGTWNWGGGVVDLKGRVDRLETSSQPPAK